MKFLINASINKVRQDKFLSSSMILLCGSLLIGVINYAYQFITARMLSVENFGELQSLLAALAITAVLNSTISTVITKYTADYKATGKLNKVYSLFILAIKRISVTSFLIFLVFIFFSTSISNFLNIQSVWPVIIIGIALLVGLPNSINSGILQGLQKFKEQTIISIISSVTKFLLTILFIKIGFELNGAVGGLTLALIITYLISFIPIKSLFKNQIEKIQTKDILKYSVPVFFTQLFTGLLCSFNIILVKHFFSAQTAGEFGALMVLSNIIYFLTGPIALVMFPMAADAQKSLTFPAKILKKSLIIFSLIGFITLGIFFLFPDFTIKLLIGSKFLSIREYLGWAGLSMFLYSLVNLFSYYSLSVGKVKATYIVSIGAILEIILICIFHSTLWQVIWIMNVVLAIILILLIFNFIWIYYLCPKN